MRIAILRIILALGLLSQSVLSAQTNNNFEIGRNTEIFMALLKELNSNYVDEVMPGKLTRTALESMLESLDPYTNYISEADVEEYRFMTTGEYGGVGVLTHAKGDTIVVSEVHDNSPAAKAGIKPGDRVLEVNGQRAIGKSDSELALVMRGEPGVEILFTVLSPGKNQTKTVTLKRENIKLGNIPYSAIIKPGIGYINLERFTQGAARDIKNAYDKLQATDSLKGLVIDLRGNGGGLLNEAVGICNLFVGKGQHIVSTRGRFESRSQEYGTTADAIAAQLPLIILVDKASASASEIVAGALQDLDRAVIIGDKTFGKGLVQNIVPLPYNAQVKITVAKYYIPSGRCIQAIDYKNRDNRGKALVIPDQMQKTFTTKGGRIVRDAGGIEPDLNTDSIDKQPNLSTIRTDHFLFDFVTLYASKHDIIPAVTEFTADDQLFDDFFSFLQRSHFPHTQNHDAYLDSFKNLITNQETNPDLVKAYNGLINGYNEAALQEVKKHKELIKSWLKTEITARYHGQRGRIEASINSDPTIAQAIHVLNNLNEYESALDGTHPRCLHKKN